MTKAYVSKQLTPEEEAAEDQSFVETLAEAVAATKRRKTEEAWNRLREAINRTPCPEYMALEWIESAARLLGLETKDS